MYNSTLQNISPMAKKRQFNRIGEVLKTKGITQAELAEAAQVEQRAVSLYVTGKREPSLEVLFRIAKALKVDACDLLNR